MIYRLPEVRRRGFDIEGPILFSFILSDKKNLGLIIIVLSELSSEVPNSPFNHAER
jgi:hypothetical protein